MQFGTAYGAHLKENFLQLFDIFTAGKNKGFPHLNCEGGGKYASAPLFFWLEGTGGALAPIATPQFLSRASDAYG